MSIFYKNCNQNVKWQRLNLLVESMLDTCHPLEVDHSCTAVHGGILNFELLREVIQRLDWSFQTRHWGKQNDVLYYLTTFCFTLVNDRYLPSYFDGLLAITFESLRIITVFTLILQLLLEDAVSVHFVCILRIIMICTTNKMKLIFFCVFRNQNATLIPSQDKINNDYLTI